jgi:hypothetical protein
MHGAGGGAPEGKRNGNFRHGHCMVSSVVERRAVRALVRALNHLIQRGGN